jgi:hypothetical protein
MTASKGTWVSIRKTILEPHERAEGIPADTSAVPLIMWVSGVLQHDAKIGEEATVITRMNRTEAGILEEINPTTQVNYGEFVPEIMQIGIQARGLLT